MSVRRSTRWFRGMGSRESFEMRIKPSRHTVFLMTDAATEELEDGALVLSEAGRKQVAAAVEHFRSMTQQVPEVWLGVDYGMHETTAFEVAWLLGAQSVRDVTQFNDYRLGRAKESGSSLPVADCSPEQPIILVTLYAHAQLLLEMAGVTVRSTSRVVRSSRMYPVLIDRKGCVRKSSLLNYFTDAPELTDVRFIPSRIPRD